MKRLWRALPSRSAGRYRDGTDKRWRGRLLDAFLVVTLFFGLSLLIVNIVLLLAVPGRMRISFVIGDALALLCLFGLWVLSRFGRTRLSGYLYLVGLIIGSSALFEPAALDRVLLLYTIPILAASFVIHPASSFAFSLLSILGYSAVYFLQRGIVSYNYVAVVGLLVVAVIGWLIASRLEQALDIAMREIGEREQAEEELRRRAEVLTALHETALDLATRRERPELLQSILARAVHLVGATAGGVYLYRPASDDLELVLAHNVPAGFTGAVLKRGEGLSGRVLELGRAMLVSDYSSWEGGASLFREAGFSAVVGVPICWADRTLGVLALLDDAPRTFSAEDIAVLERFAPLAAAALENARLLNDLQEQMERLQATQKQLIQSARLAGVGELAAGVAHELNNPLAIILGFAELLRDAAVSDSTMRGDAERIIFEAQRASEIVRNLLDFARQTAPFREPTAVNQVIQETVDVIRHYVERDGVVIEEDYGADVGVLRLDEGQMKQVLLNLITNAAHAMPQGGTLRVHTSRVGEEVVIAISDTGEGIPPEIHDRIFDPFFSTRPGGTGLGLPVSLGIVQEHGGRIVVKSRPGNGSIFTIWLPVDQEI